MITKLRKQSFIEEIKQKIYYNSYLKSNKKEIYFFDREKKFSIEERNKIVIEGQSTKMTIDQICIRESITPSVFNQWTNTFLKSNKFEFKKVLSPKKIDLSEDQKNNIVIEGKSGVTSIAEICKRESITHDTFLEWSRNFLELRKRKLQELKIENPLTQKNRLLIRENYNLDTFNYIENYIDFTDQKLLVILRSDSVKLDKLKEISSIICFQKINDIRYINKYFERINTKLPQGGVFVGCLETFTARRNRLVINKIPIIKNLYFSFEFLINRILPKLAISKEYYFDITKGNNRLLSKAEGLGRLVSSGFKIMDYKTINGLLYFVVKKINKPAYDLNPSYGPIYKMPRLGKNGKIINVYKLRTMHPYSEYLQDYILKANGYADTGKPAEDFRIPEWGKVIRKYWIDELPQLLNVLKGEMKLVGIRPVSERYFQDIPKEMQKLRLTQKPGCIPPYVSLNREGNVMSVLQAEKDYLEEKIKNHYTTDIKYFFKAIFNIVFHNKRSA